MGINATREAYLKGTVPDTVMTLKAREVLIQGLGEAWARNLTLWGPTIDEATAHKIVAAELKHDAELRKAAQARAES